MGASKQPTGPVAGPREWSRGAATAAAAYRELCARLGERLVHEERASEHGHAPWDAYRLAMDEPSLHRLLLDALRGEPDQVMALGPVLAVVEGDDAALARSALDVLAPGSREQLLAEQRAHDVAVVRAAAAGDAGSAEPADTWSPWAQGRASGTATDLRVLDVLTANGISRRVRGQARDRARRVRRAAGGAARGLGSVEVDGPEAS